MKGELIITEGYNGCIEWTGARSDKGYGLRNVAGRVRRVHRLEWEKANGPILDGMKVLHTCDNPPCHNVDHLFLGTSLDNTRDMIAKGRHVPPPHPFGEAHPSARLTNAEVAEIRALYQRGGYTHRGLARMFGVSHARIGALIRRQGEG